MSQRIKKHCDNCVAYQTSKHSYEKSIGHLYSIPASDESFHTIMMDFVTGLPPLHGHDALLTITNKFSKAIKLIPCRMIDSTEDAAKLYLRYIYTTFRLPTKIISNHDLQIHFSVLVDPYEITRSQDGHHRSLPSSSGWPERADKCNNGDCAMLFLGWPYRFISEVD